MPPLSLVLLMRATYGYRKRLQKRRQTASRSARWETNTPEEQQETVPVLKDPVHINSNLISNRNGMRTRTRIILGVGNKYGHQLKHQIIRLPAVIRSYMHPFTRHLQHPYKKDACNTPNTPPNHNPHLTRLQHTSNTPFIPNTPPSLLNPTHSPNTSRRLAFGASNVCLVGENPTCAVPAL